MCARGAVTANDGDKNIIISRCPPPSIVQARRRRMSLAGAGGHLGLGSRLRSYAFACTNVGGTRKIISSDTRLLEYRLPGCMQASERASGQTLERRAAVACAHLCVRVH